MILNHCLTQSEVSTGKVMLNYFCDYFYNKYNIIFEVNTAKSRKNHENIQIKHACSSHSSESELRYAIKNCCILHNNISSKNMELTINTRFFLAARLRTLRKNLLILAETFCLVTCSLRTKLIR